MEYTQQQIDTLKEELGNVSLLDDYFCAEELLFDAESAEELREYIQERIYEQEVIYYTAAADFLREHDPSLKNSIGLATDLGCDTANLSSETLATLLLQHLMTQELCTLELEPIFEQHGE